MSINKRKRELQRLAQSLYPDAIVERTRGSHFVIQIDGPEGTRKVFASSTSSDHRDLKNLKREIANAMRVTGVANQNGQDEQ